MVKKVLNSSIWRLKLNITWQWGEFGEYYLLIILIEICASLHITIHPKILLFHVSRSISHWTVFIFNLNMVNAKLFYTDYTKHYFTIFRYNF